MSRSVVSLHAVIWALAVTSGAYIALLFALSTHLASRYDEVAASVVMVSGSAILARLAVKRVSPDNDFRKMISICRNLPLQARVFGALGLVVTALIFDRYLDGSPETYRLSSFVIPVMVSIVMFDLRPGLFAVGASALALDLLIVTPTRGIDPLNWLESIDGATVIFLLAAASLVIDKISRDRAARREKADLREIFHLDDLPVNHVAGLAAPNRPPRPRS